MRQKLFKIRGVQCEERFRLSSRVSSLDNILINCNMKNLLTIGKITGGQKLKVRVSNTSRPCDTPFVTKIVHLYGPYVTYMGPM